MRKSIFIVMVMTLLAKGVGFAKEIILSYYYGASNISDAYLISLTIPTVVFSIIIAAIKTTYMPIFSGIDKHEGREKSNLFTGNLLNILFIVSTLIIIIIFLFTRQIVLLFASGFDVETMKLAINLTRISVFSIYFLGSMEILKAYLQMENSFAIPALSSIPMNLVIIISIYFSTIYGYGILGYGKVIGLVIAFMLMIPILKRKGFRFVFVLNVKDTHIKNMMILMIPTLLGISVDQINKLVDRTIASRVEVGGISALNYANKLNTFILGIFVTSFITVLYARISKMASEGQISDLKKVVKQNINSMNIILTPITIGAILFSAPIVNMLFGRGAFDEEALSMTVSALMFYSVGMIGFGIREVLTRAFYALKDTKTPMRNSAVGMVLNILLNILLSIYLGIGGLALATSIAVTFIAGLMFISLRKKIGPFGMKQISISFLKILFASLVMGGLAKLSFNYLTASLSQNLSLLLAIGVGAVSYFVIIYFMKIEDVDVIVVAIKKKLGRGSA